MGATRTDDRLFWIAFAVLSAGFCLPLLLFDVLPSQDAPNHFAIAATLAREGQAGWDVYFDSKGWLSPYGGYYRAASLLAGVFEPGLAARIPVLLYLILLPLSVVHLASRAGASRWAALLSFGLVFGDLYLLGFIPYLLGLPLVMWAASLWAPPTRPRQVVGQGVLLVVAGLVALLLHPLVLLTLLGVVVVVTFAGPRRQWPFAAPAILAAIGVIVHYGSGAGSFDFISPATKLVYLVRAPIALVDALPGSAWMFHAAMWLALAGAACLRMRSAGLPPVERRHRFLLVALVVAYFALPFRAGDAIFFDLRLAPVVWLLALAMVPRSFVSGAAKVVVVLFLTVMLVGQITVHRRFAAESAGLADLCESLPPGKKVLGLISPEASDTLQPVYSREGWAPFSPYAHAPSVCLTERGGRSPTMTFHPSLTWMPLRLVPGDDLEDIGIADVFDGLRLASQLDQRARHYDYLLVVSKLDAMHDAAGRHGTALARHGRFGLYAVDREVEAEAPDAVESNP